MTAKTATQSDVTDTTLQIATPFLSQRKYFNRQSKAFTHKTKFSQSNCLEAESKPSITRYDLFHVCENNNSECRFTSAFLLAKKSRWRWSQVTLSEM